MTVETKQKSPPENQTGGEEIHKAPEKKWRFNSPLVQVSLMGLVCFCCPGMFNALSGMGGGGQVDPTAANNANTAVYTAFTIFGVLGGAFYNVLGPRLTLAVGCSTYVLYAASFLYYNHHHHQAFAIVAGALLGCGAGLLWAGEGAVMTSYPPPHRKGLYIALFWSIFNLGGVIGGLIPFILNYNRSSAVSVNDATYIAFMCFMFAGVLLSLGILPASSVIRNDGSKCSAVKYSKPSKEFAAVLRLFLDRKMLLIVPAAWASNFFYSYQFNNVNGLLFNLRTRGFNNVFYWGAQMVGSISIGYVMDFSFKSRRARGFAGISLVAVIGTAIWAGGLVNQHGYSSKDLPDKKLDFKDSGSGFVGPFLLYMCYGLLDAMYQSMVYWLIGALADDSQTLSRYSGFYKGVQSAGAAVAWQVDTRKVPLMSQLIVNWSLTTVRNLIVHAKFYYTPEIYTSLSDLISGSCVISETTKGYPDVPGIWIREQVEACKPLWMGFIRKAASSSVRFGMVAEFL